MSSPELHKWTVGKLEAEIRHLLERSGSDAELRGWLEALAEHNAFSGFTWLWGPALYIRNRVFFEPFILRHFGTHLLKGLFYSPVRWTGEAGDRLKDWLAQVEQDGNVELFRRLFAYRLQDQVNWKFKEAENLYRKEVLSRVHAGLSPAQRKVELSKLDSYFTLDEPTALHLFKVDKSTSAFILRHLPWARSKHGFWEKLFATALEEKQDDFAWKLYRRLVDLSRWEKDLQQQLTKHDFIAELEKRHPDGWIGDLGKGMLWVLEARGREGLPYVMRHLSEVFRPWFGTGSYGTLLKLATQQGWLDLWAALLRTCATPAEYNAALRAAIDDSRLDRHERIRRILSLAGVSREWNWSFVGIAQVQQLEEKTALLLYQRHPSLLRGPFLLHLQVPRWSSGGYAKLVERVLAENDEELIDFLASRYLSLFQPGKDTEALAAYYEALQERGGGCNARFARRAANVLTRIPPYGIWNYKELMRKNRLARLFFERSAQSYLADEGAVADLVEGAEIHVQMLAYRVLGLDDPRAHALAAQHMLLLQATLLRPLQRNTRRRAFLALANAARHSQESARTVLERCKEAMRLPDKRYPKEAAIGLMGRILALWRYLRGPREHLTIYRYQKPSAESGASASG